MLNQIIRFSLKQQLLVLVGAVMLIVGGIYTTQQTDIDVFPDLTAPTVVVMTDAHSMASEEVERLVSFPIETAVNGATNVRRVRSASLQGYSFVWVEFDWGMDIYKARQVVSEKMVTLSGTLPQGVVPVLAPQSSIMGEILFVSLQAKETSMMELRTLADWVVKPNILATGGVSQVTIIGGDLKQYQILANPQKMAAYKVTLDELEAVGKTFSSNAEGGVVRDYGNEFILRGMGRTTDIKALGATFIKRYKGQPVVVSDVAEVVIAPAIKMGHASHNAKPAILLSISKQPNINTLKVTKQIEENLKKIEASLPGDVVMDTHIFRQADFIQAAVDNVGNALLEGAFFVVVVLFIFLGSFRTTLISVIAIPISLLATIIVLYFMGININTMTLGGMCIAIGSLVDDAIIDVENVYKRLRENHGLPKSQQKSIFQVVFDGSAEIRASVLNATLIIIVSFLPLFFLHGLEGRMLKPLGIAYIVSLFMSLIVAMTLTPLLCKLLLAQKKYLEKKKKEKGITQWLNKQYSCSLIYALKHKKIVLGSTLVLLMMSIFLLTQMGRSFLPEFNEGSLTISAVAKPGISLDENHKLGTLIEQELLQIPEVISTSRRTGRGELDEHSQATNGAEIDVKFMLNHRSKETFMHEVRKRLASVPGVSTTVGQPLGHRIDHMVSGTRASIAIKLFGTDLSRMFLMGNKIKSITQNIPGLVDVSVAQQTETPQLQIRANRARLAQYGITMETFNHFIGLAFSGEKIADIYEGQRSFGLVLRLNKDYTERVEQIKTALIDTPNGGKVPLEEVAEIVSVGGPNTITRENVQRKLVVSANVSGRDVNSVVEDIQKVVKEKMDLPEGYRIVYGGQFESAQKASRTLLYTSLAAILIIFLLLYTEFKDSILSLIILINLPLSLIGGICAVYLDSSVISIPAIIGFITLFGIATRNGILLISRYQHLNETGEDLNTTIIHGSTDRLNPIIMTALTSSLALIPMILHSQQSGNEIQSPMAVVVLGGLFTSTLLNIYVIPIVYQLVMNRKKKQA
jgi:CzcA family heavy metal efflux pump